MNEAGLSSNASLAIAEKIFEDKGDVNQVPAMFVSGDMSWRGTLTGSEATALNSSISYWVSTHAPLEHRG